MGHAMTKLLTDDELFGAPAKGNLLTDEDLIGSSGNGGGNSSSVLDDIGLKLNQGTTVDIPQQIQGINDVLRKTSPLSILAEHFVPESIKQARQGVEDLLRKNLNERADEIQSRLSPEQKSADKKQYFSDDASWEKLSQDGITSVPGKVADLIRSGGLFGDAWSDWRKPVGGAVQSAPSTLVAMGPTAKIAGTAGKQAFARVLAETGSEKLAQEAAVKSAERTAMAVGGLSEGVQGAGAANEQTRQIVMSMPIDDLRKSQYFNEQVAAFDGDETKARIATADRAATISAGGAMLFDTIFGALGDRYLGSAVAGKNSRLRSAIRGGMEETPTEFIQSGGEKASENLAIQKTADPTRKLMANVGEEAVGGAMSGGIMGIGMGGAFHSNANVTQGSIDRTPDASDVLGIPAGQPDDKKTEAERALYEPKSLTALDRVSEIDKEIQTADPAKAVELQAERDNITRTWPKAVPGAETSFSTEAGARVDAQYALMEAGDLNTSHDENLRANPAYPQELQPRQRDRAASEMQVSSIVQRLDPVRLGESADAANGAPIVGADGLVESGNARTIALKRVYGANGAKADAYKQFLTDNAERFGISPESVQGMNNPVLVRVRTTPVNRAEFARQANASTVAQMSPSEQARSDAARIDDMGDLTPDDNGDFTNADSRGFVRRFMAKLPGTEQAGMIDANGALSQTGYARIRNAVLAKAYGDSPVLMRMVESMDDNLRNLSKALMKVAPQVAKARQGIADGVLHDADVTPDLMAAVTELSRLKDEGKSVKDALSQQGMFGGYSEETRQILSFLDENMRRPRQMAEFVQRYFEALEAAGNPNQGSLLGEAQAPAKGDLLQAARGQENAEQAGQHQGNQATGAQAGQQPGGAQRDGGGAQGNENSEARNLATREVSRRQSDGHTTIEYAFGGDGFAQVHVYPDGRAYITNIQLGEAGSSQRAKGEGTKAYSAIGQALANEGITLESTRWSKHRSAIAPAALRVWEKLVEAGIARQTGTETGKVADRFGNVDEVRDIPVFEFVSGGSSETRTSTSEWVTFPPDSGTLGIPRAQMAAQASQANDAQTRVEQGAAPQARIKRLQAQLDNTEPFTEQSSALTDALQSAVTQDAQSALNAGEIPVYKVTDHVSVAIHPSAQNPGMVQVTRYTKDGVIGDSQYNSVDDAVRQEGLTHKPRIASNEAVAAIEKSIQAEAEYQQRKNAAPVPNADAGVGVGGKSGIAKGASGIAQRQANAANNFIDSVQEQFGLSKEDAGKAWDHFVQNKLVKIDAVGGQYSLTDGRLWDGEVMRRAASGNQEPAKAKPNRRQIDATKDTLFQAIAKLGGMDTQELTSNGFDPKDISIRHNGRVIQSGKNKGQLTKPSFKPRSLGFNMPLHKKGGMSFDGMLEALTQHGYFPEGATKNDAIEAFRRELGGDVVVTPDAEMRRMEEDQAARDAEQLAEQEANDAIGYDDLNEREKALVDFNAETVYDEDNPIEAFRRGMKSAGATEEEINEAIKQTFGAQETGDNDSSRAAQRTGEDGNAQGVDNGLEDGSIQEGAEPDWLTGQTNDQAAEQFAQQKAAKEKEAADKKAAEDKAKADAEANDFRLAGSDRAADVAVAGGQQDIFAQQKQANTVQSNAKSDASLARTKDRNEVRFETPYVGIGGNYSLVGYVWPNKKEEYIDRRGEDRVRTVSDWEAAVENLETGRQIVHQFAVKKSDGTEQDVSAETAARLLGVSESTVRNNAKKQLEKAIAKEKSRILEIKEADDLDAIDAQDSPAMAVSKRAMTYSNNSPMIERMAKSGESWAAIDNRIERESAGREKYRFLTKDGKFVWSHSFVKEGDEEYKRGWRNAEFSAREIWPAQPVKATTEAKAVDPAAVDSKKEAGTPKVETDKGTALYSKSQDATQSAPITRTEAESRIKSILGDKLGKVLIDSGIVTLVDTEQGLRNLNGAKYMVAWHGSPHDHNKFDSSKIGTGEGAQAYGYGLYFAGSRDVAEYYKETLTNRDAQGYANAHLNAKNLVDRFNGDAEWAAEVVSDQLRNTEQFDQNYGRLQKTLEFIKSGAYAKPLDNPGKLYQVELAPSEDEYLDWDKPLSEQSEFVRKALDGNQTIADRREKLESRKHIYTKSVDSMMDMTGQELYELIADNPTTIRAPGDKAASDYLHSIGIRGIRYLDGSSRSAGEGTSNYVIFSDDDVAITAKYAKENGGIRGATLPDGRIVLVLENLNADNFDGVFAHEGFHSAIRDLVGEQTYAQLMKRLDNMRALGNGGQWFKDAVASVPAGTRTEHVTEEIAAYAVQGYVNGAKQPNVITRWVESLLSALRTAIIRRLPSGKLKSWAVNNLQPQDLANLAIAGLKAKARGQLQAQGREAMALSRNENGANVSRMADKDTVAGTQAPTSVSDGSTGSAKAPHIAAAEQILSLMDDPVYTYGLRVLPSDFTDPVKPRETIPSSFVWQDGDITDEEINGVSTAGIRRSDLESVLAAMKNLGVTGKNGPNGYYFGSRVVLVRGDSNGSGQDVGETIIRDPEVLGEWKKPNNGLSEVMPNEPSASAGSDATRLSRSSQIANKSTVVQRAEEIINKSAATWRPVDDVMRVLTNATRFDRATGALYDMASKLLDRVPEQIKAGVVSDYGVPEAVIDRRVQAQGRMRVQMRKAGELIDKLSTLTRAESRVAYEWMNNNDPQALKYFEAQLPEESVKVMEEVKGLIDQLSQEAVSLGQLSEDAFKHNRFEYLRRSYVKHTAELTKGETEARRRAIAILGDQYKGRGMTDSVDMAKFRNVAPEWWGRKLKEGQADKGLKGEKFIRLERRKADGAGVMPLEQHAGPGDTNPKKTGKLLEVVYWPAGEALPAKFADWENAGTWEVRDTKGKNLIVWRDFTKQERIAMGEIDEARYAIAKTLHGMIHDVETGRYLDWLATTYAKKPGEAIDGEIIEASERMRDTFKPGTWVQVPETKIPGTSVVKYGKLAGRYIPGPIWNDVRQTVGFRFKPLGETYAAILGAWKTAKTALSPAVHTNNVMANFVMADWHDVTAGHVLKALRILLGASERDGKGLIGRAGNVASRAGMSDAEAAREVMNRYQDSGGNIGTWAVSELQKDQLEPLLAAMEKELGLAGETAGGQVGVWVALQKALQLRFPSAWEAFKPSLPGRVATTEARNLISLYEAEDQVFRLAAWLKAKEEGASDIAAGKVARKSFLDYHINAPWIQAMRNTAFPFVSFTYRSVPMLIEIAAKKPHKLMKLALVAAAVNALGYMMSGGDEDDERKLLPEEKAGKIWGLVPKLVRMPWNDKFGDPVFLDIRRFVPVGDIFDTGSTNSAMPILPAMVPGGPLAILAELALNKTQFTGKPITLETDSPDEKAVKIADYLYKSLMPNVPVVPGTYSWTGIANASKGKTDAFGRELSTPQAVASAFGVKLGSYPKDVLMQNLKMKEQADLMEVQKNIRQLKREHQRNGIDDAEFEKKMAAQVAKQVQIKQDFQKRINGR